MSSTEKGRGAHTPGPLAYDPEEGRIYVDDGDVEPTVGYIDLDNTDEEQALADGLLFAAAPDLLESERQNLSVLENLLAYLRKHEAALPPCSTASLEVRIEATRAAIRRATGESSK